MESIYQNVLGDSFDSAASGNTQGQITRIEKTLLAPLNSTINEILGTPYDSAGRFPLTKTAKLNKRTGAISTLGGGFNQLREITDGPFVVDIPGEFVYLDRDIFSALAVAEVYLAFDDADPANAVAIAPGTALQRKFRKFRVVSFAPENAAALNALNGTLDEFNETRQWAAMQFKCIIGTNLALHSRPDLRVKISDVGSELVIGAATVNVLATLVAGMYQETGGILNGAPQATVDDAGTYDTTSSRVQNMGTILAGNPLEAAPLFSNPVNPGYSYPAGQFLQTVDGLRAAIRIGALAAPITDPVGCYLVAFPYDNRIGGGNDAIELDGTLGPVLGLNVLNEYGCLILDSAVFPTGITAYQTLLKGEYKIPSGYIACAVLVGTTGPGANVLLLCDFTRWMIGANQLTGGVA